MPEFRVWAPLGKKVELCIGADTILMREAEGDWWACHASVEQSNCDYGFLINDEGPFPDPRSPWQPNGVHKLSRRVDPATLSSTNSISKIPSLASAIIYELHVGTFTPEGTFAAVIEKLEHLVKLGITHVELMPVNEFSGTHGWGYDGVGLFAPHHAYGKPADLKKLVDSCHAHGLAVLLDVVYNHLGPSGNYLGKFGPYFTDRYSVPWGAPLNFDGPDSDEVRRFFCDNALMWLRDYQFDGLRLDAVHAIMDTSAEPFLEQLSREVKDLSQKINRPLVLIAESDLNDPRLLWPHERGGFNLDAQWSDDFHHALHGVLTREQSGYYAGFGTLENLAKTFRDVFVFDGCYSATRRRRHGRPPEGLGGDHFLAYLQNHDQVGNRAQGERSGKLMSLGRLKIGAALVFTSPFLPMIFQGEEWAASTPFQYFTAHEEPELASAVSKGRCAEFAAFGWKPEDVPDPQSADTFARSKLNWSEMKNAPHEEMLEWHRQLIQLRKTEPDLHNGRRDQVVTRFSENDRWLVIERGQIVVACNLANNAQKIVIPNGKYEQLLSSHSSANQIVDAVELPPDSVIILKRS